MSEPRLSRPRGFALALLTAALMRLALPPYDVPALVFVAWAPLLWVCRRSTTRDAAAFGFVAGFGLNFVAHGWLVGVLQRNAGNPALQGLLALSAVATVGGLRTALVAALVSRACARRLPIWLSFPVFQVLLDLAMPALFPWTMALAVHTTPVWAQLARLGGTAAVSLWLGATNALVVEAVDGLVARRAAPVIARSVAATVGLLLVVTSYGSWSIARETHRAQVAPRLRISIGHLTSLHEAGDELSALRDRELELQQVAGDSDVAIWPEGTSSTPIQLGQIGRIARDYWQRNRAAALSAPPLHSELLLGSLVEQPDGLENAALLVAPGGELQGRYVKRRLMPLGEMSALVGLLGPPVTSFRAGEPLPRLSIHGHPIATSICFEDLFADDVREEVVRVSGELLVNLTSDRWFRGTSAVDFHFALAKMRAIEEGKYLVRATRDGVSGVVDSTGAVVERMAANRSAVARVDVPMLRGQTPYTWLADWLNAAVYVGAMLLFWACFQPRSRPPRSLRKSRFSATRAAANPPIARQPRGAGQEAVPNEGAGR